MVEGAGPGRGGAPTIRPVVVGPPPHYYYICISGSGRGSGLPRSGRTDNWAVAPRGIGWFLGCPTIYSIGGIGFIILSVAVLSKQLYKGGRPPQPLLPPTRFPELELPRGGRAPGEQ